MQWLRYQVHTISWFLFVFSNFSVKKQNLKRASRTICRLMPTTFSLTALPTFLHSILYFPLGHTLNTSFSFLSPGPCFMDIFLCSCRGGWGVGRAGVLKAVAALSAVEGGTKREAILFPYTRFLCGCQPPCRSLCMC